VKYLTLIISFFILNFAYPGSLRSDLRKKGIEIQKVKRIKPKKELNPRRALLYSAIFPGAGQLYARRYLKAPLFAGIFINTLSFYVFYNKEYNVFTDIYNDRQKGIRTDKYTIAGGAAVDFSDQTIKGGIDFYERKRETMMAYLIGIYLFNLLDAFVSASMRGYDVSDDLSFSPYIDTQRNNVGMAVNIKL
jgi:hypothetical protein